jgi:uncharacterized membrane protein YqiK
MFFVVAMWIAGVVLVLWFVIYLIGIRVIKSTEVGIVEKWWSSKGSLDKSIIALNGEAGFQPELLRGGIHFRSPFIYRVYTVPLITINQGKIGYLFARDGKQLSPTQLLGKVVSDFLDAREFLQMGGQRGPQRGILREGTYAINTALFAVITDERVHYLPMGGRDDSKEMEAMRNQIDEVDGFTPIIIDGRDDRIGIVTVNDGSNPGEGHIICPTVGNNSHEPATYHHSFQDPEKFLIAGGQRGKQNQVLLDGKYYINRLFATVKYVPKTVINVGFVGVVISYFGEKGDDTSGDSYTHGELVEEGKRGIWNTPLMPGKYAINTDAAKVIPIPTTNFVLKWDASSSGEHGFDQGLAAVKLITKDAFEPELPLSVVLSIDYKEAPQLIQRFGDVKLLVEQSLDPMVSAFFKNAGQTRTLLLLIQERSELGIEALDKMSTRFNEYNLKLHDVLIGTPRSVSGDDRIETMYTQLRDRQIATEQVETYKRQGQAADQEKQLRLAQAAAKQQTQLTESEINITVQGNIGQAQRAKTVQDAQSKVIMTEAEANSTLLLANADSTRVAKMGVAEGIATQQKVNAFGGAEYQVYTTVLTAFAEALKVGKQPLVPSTQITMGGEGNTGGGNALSLLLNLLSMKQLRELAPEGADKNVTPEMQQQIDELTKSVMSSINPNPQK